MEGLKDRYQRCVIAMKEADTPDDVASMTCAQAVFGSRGYKINPRRARKTQSRSRRRTATRRRNRQ